jgi:exonuclease III
METQIKIATWNVCLGVRNKIALVKKLLIDSEIDILCIQEAEVDADDDLGLLEIKDYNLELEISRDRNTKRRTLMYVNRRIDYERTMEAERAEAHIIIITLKGYGGIGLASIYRTYKLTHKEDHKSALEEQITILNAFITAHKRIIILGDINLDYRRKADSGYHHQALYQQWKAFEDDNQLIQMVDFVTWQRLNRGRIQQSILDHVYTNDLGMVEQIEQGDAFISDHKPVIVWLAQRVKIEKTREWLRDWTKYTESRLVEELAKIDFNIRCLTVQDFNDELEQKLMHVTNIVAPFKWKVITNNDKNESPKLANLKRRKKNIYTNIKRRGIQPRTLIESKRLDKEIRKTLTGERRRKIREKIKNNPGSGLWEAYKLARDEPITRMPEYIEEEEKSLKTPEEKAAGFARYFMKKVDVITRNSTIMNDIYNGERLDKTPDENFFTMENVKKAISELKPKTCFGFDRIPLKVIKHGGEILLKPIHKILNMIYEQNVIPEQWKTSRIIPLHKKGSRRKIENYRPISNQCSLTKIFEKLMLQRILKVEDDAKSDFFGKRQHGFRKSKSTVTAAMNLQHDIATALDQDDYYAVASLDLSAAFDVINLELLMKRLEIMGLPDDIRRMLGAWLFGRTGFVEVESYCSEIFDIDNGTVQGSGLGPVLFNMFMRPFMTSSGSLSYADDSYMGSRHHNKNTAVQELQAKLIKAEQWMSGSGLKVNIEKTEFTLFHRLDTSAATIQIGESIIESTSSIKVLGIIFDNRLQWTQQVEKAITSAKKSLQAVKTIRKFFNEEETVDLITSLVFSKMYYGAPVWLLPNLKEKLFANLYSQSGRSLKIANQNLSYKKLHKKYNRATPKIFSNYLTAINLHDVMNGKFPDMYQDTTLNTLSDRRNVNCTFVRNNRYRVGLNKLSNRLRTISNIIPKVWLNNPIKTYKTDCKKIIIQNSPSDN